MISMFLVLLLGGVSSRSVGQEIANLAKAKAPAAQWKAGAVLVGDVNGDGVDDYSIMGRARGKIFVAVILGPKSSGSRVEVLSFGIGDNSQSSFCGQPTEFSLSSADFDSAEDDGVPWEGFVRSKTAKVIEIGGDGCDPFELYWNHKADVLAWYRH